eukprot:CAMPEP_0117463120 /NCGR_PEP_ID=MMETSP0784-20121206/3410_1 /TAXON_ID=39447 /ORGANISM="" /LENGTH=553 /DNA_ID=CAMNT_0005256915 /DNA_START=10 /DNA_END=1669 /DNA_ORIENTATION=-
MQVLDSAVVDTTCNSIVGSVSDPVSMMERIIDVRQSIGADAVTQNCIEFHCLVLREAYTDPRTNGNALQNKDLVNMAGSAPTNVHGMKVAGDTTCPCNWISLGNSATSLAAQFGDLCLPLTTKFQENANLRRLYTLNGCYGKIMTSKDSGELNSFLSDSNCTSVVMETSTVAGYFGAIAAGRGRTDSICTSFMCSAFIENLPAGGYGCDWNTQPLAAVTTQEVEAVSTYCGNSHSELKSLDSIVNTICTAEGVDASAVTVCGAAQTTTAAPEGNGASARPAAASGGRGTVGHNSSAIKAPAARTSTHQIGKPPRVDGAGGSRMESRNGDSTAYGARSSSPREAFARHLQDSDPAVDNEDLEDWNTGDWSHCTCYQPCMGGVKARSVTCPSGVTCKRPKPAEAESCECWHCARCNLFYTVLFFSGGYFVQGSIALLMWLAFWRISVYDEEDWSSVGFCAKILGFFCKFLPVLIRFFTIFAMIFLCVILIQAFVPLFEQQDCKSLRDFQVMAVFVTLIWVVQVSLGVYMARKQPMPPWLHSQTANKSVRILCRPC